MKPTLVFLTVLFKFSLCRDFLVGFHRKNDVLVAQDTLYKESNYFGYATAKYGRIFKCPITYFRVADRLGMGRPPTVTVTRGGLRKKYVTLLLTSAYGMPIAVNIYVGCENKEPPKTTTTEAPSDELTGEEANTEEAEEEEPAEEEEGEEEAAEEEENAEENNEENAENEEERTQKHKKEASKKNSKKNGLFYCHNKSYWKNSGEEKKQIK